MSDRRKPLMQRADIEATLRPFEQARPLAGAPYRKPAILHAEFEAIFGARWVCVGHISNLAATGDFLVREIGAESVLVVRDDDRVAAFFNVCRHRGTRLVGEDRGTGLKCVRCPYHAWSYGLDGALIAAPMMDEVEGFDKAQYPLSPVRCEVWQGFVFVCFDDAAAPLSEYLRDFPDVGGYDLASLRVAATHRYELAANWKLVCENYGECYHCPTNHPQLNPISDFNSGGDSFAGAAFCGGPMRLNDGCVTMTVDGQTERPPFAGLAPAERRLVHYFNIYPAFLLSLHPDYVLTHTIWPIAPDRSLIRCEWLFAADELARPGFDPSDAVEFWDTVNRQDWELCERAQRGVQSRGYRPGRYHRLEETIYFFDSWYLRTMKPALLAGSGAE